jgi:uncharacterized phiE125 gp8 family phage protein
MGLVLNTAPAIEPVPVDDLRNELRLDDNYDDAALTRRITAARQTIEAIQNRQLITATWEYTLDYWDSVIRLPMGPLQIVNSVKYYDAAGTLQTLAASEYQVDITGLVGEIVPAPDAFWPVLEIGRKNAVIVNYDSGYGDTAADVPANTKLAIIALASHWYENRLVVEVGNSTQEVPMHIKWMLTPESVPELY